MEGCYISQCIYFYFGPLKNYLIGDIFSDLLFTKAQDLDELIV